MDDPQIHGTIEQLIAEKHELWPRESAGEATDAASVRPVGVVERYER